MSKSKPKAKEAKKAYSVLPQDLQQVSSASLLLAESSSGPKITVPFGYMLAVSFPPETENAYRENTARPFVDNNEK